MRTPRFRIPAMLAVVLLIVGMVLPGGAAAQTDTPKLPSHLKIVDGADTETWAQAPGSQATGSVQLVMHVDRAPLAMVGKLWTHEQRRQYVQDTMAMQDPIVQQVQALGGEVIGRFLEASSGLAVVIDASKVQDLRGIDHVVGVTGIANYQVDLTETVPWIGAAELQAMGVTGKHNWTGQGIDVAVIDSGIDFTHAKFGGPGTAQAYAQAYCGDPNATPARGCGTQAYKYAPDPALFGPGHKVVGGYDWVGENWPTYSSGISPDPNPIALKGTGNHGTHVADIIGGLESAPGAGDPGVAPGVNLWAFKACSALSSSCNGLALLLSVDDALDLDNSDQGACTPGVDEGCTTFDPADVINMSLGSPYGQPEDDLTHFANIASYYGSVMVISAGNSGDRPYIVGSPSAAAGAISVAESTVPSAKLEKVTAGSQVAGGLWQAWSPAITGVISGPLQYGDGAGGSLLGCSLGSNPNSTDPATNPFPAGSLAGKVVLLDRGVCSISIKGMNASAAGAVLVLVANNAFSNTPPNFSYGGGAVTAPVLSITQTDGVNLKTVTGQTATLDPASPILLQDDIVATSSRGPNIASGAIKPDIAAPGASVSAEAGTGAGKTAFGGTSGAAPMIAGAAALMVQNLEQRGILNDANPGVVRPGISLTPLVKAMLQNTANPNVYIGGSLANGGKGFVAPITLTGAGRVDALAAYNTGTVALDVTDLANWLEQRKTGVYDVPCTVSASPLHSETALLLGLTLPEWYDPSTFGCLSAYPYGNDFFNAWNAMAGSVSFGYDGVSANYTETRKVLIANLTDQPQTYSFTPSLRYTDDQGRGVTISVSPSALTVPPKQLLNADVDNVVVNVTLTVEPAQLRTWTLDAGTFGASGTNIYCDPNDPGSINPKTGCPTLTMFEYDGFITIDGGPNPIRMPWQALPKKAGDTSVLSKVGRTITLQNVSPNVNTYTDAFALMEQSPNECEIVDPDGNCLETDYVPGILPGINMTAIDMKEIGVRGYTVPDISKWLKFAANTPPNDDVLDFGITVYDKPFRASHNYPVELDVYIDSNADGTWDYVAFNADLTLNAADGRNAVFVADVNGADGVKPTRPYFFAQTNFNSQNWILPVPAGAVDITPMTKFKFQVLAFDAYFTGSLWDCSPHDCVSAFTYTARWPKFRPGQYFFQVPAASTKPVPYLTPVQGQLASPSQIGLLFMYRDAPVEKESNSVLLP